MGVGPHPRNARAPAAADSVSAVIPDLAAPVKLALARRAPTRPAPPRKVLIDDAARKRLPSPFARFVAGLPAPALAFARQYVAAVAGQQEVTAQNAPT